MILKVYFRLPFWILLLIGVLLGSCRREGKAKRIENDGAMEVKSFKSAKQLSRIHCAGCHLYPEPGLLNKKAWEEGVLPAMANHLGIHGQPTPHEELFEPGAAGERVRQSGIYPAKPVLSQENWEKIQKFYIENSPESLNLSDKTITKGIESIFETKKPNFNLKQPLVTMVEQENHSNGILIADVKRDNSKLFLLDSSFEQMYATSVPEAPVAVKNFDGGYYLLTMGRMYPSDAADGALTKIDYRESGGIAATPILDQLQRPVAMMFSDLDSDGLEDIVIAQFGRLLGTFGWHKNLGDNTYKYQSLLELPGALSVAIEDMNKDGHNDIVVLFAQAQERICIFYGDGFGNFKQEVVKRFQSTQGSNAMQLVDWNNDGHQDILHISGDNADYSPISKPYHGIRLFLNDGQNYFKEIFFLDHCGAYDAKVNDFDGDGDLDIAAISFFPDYAQYPEESFILYENKGDDQFIRRSFEEATLGRWIRLSMMDFDRDGDQDLILGSFIAFPPDGDTTGLWEKWQGADLPLLLLENKAK